MATPNPFPLPIQQKVNNPHIQALLEQYGHDKYVNAEDVNKIIQALNFLHENINGDGDSAYLTYSEYLQDVLVRLEDKEDILTDIIFGNFINGLNVKNTLIDNDEVISRNSVTGKSVKTSWLNVWVSNLRTKVINEIASALFAFKVAEVDTKIPLSQKAAVNGVATLGPDTKVPAAQLKFGDVAGTITEGNDPRLVEAFAKKINAISVTGDSNKTITLTREDGTTLTATFLDKDTEYPDDVINTLNFNANNDGVLIAITSEGEVLSVSLDGRYSIIGHTHSINEITGLEDALNGKENTFSKNTAFNKDFGTTAGKVAEGNDSRVLNGQTAFSWGNYRDFGIGGNGTLALNLNSIQHNGLYIFTDVTLNRPFEYGSVTVNRINDSYILQIAEELGGQNRIATRSSNDGLFSAWNLIANNNQLLLLENQVATDYVPKYGNATIFNIKTFESSPIVPVASSYYQSVPYGQMLEVTNDIVEELETLQAGDTAWINLTATLPMSYSEIVLRYKIKNNTYILDFSAKCDGSGVGGTLNNHIICSSLPKVDSEKARFINLENFKEEISGGGNGTYNLRIKSDGNYGSGVSLICGLKDTQAGTSGFRAVLPIVDFN